MTKRKILSRYYIGRRLVALVVQEADAFRVVLVHDQDKTPCGKYKLVANAYISAADYTRRAGLGQKQKARCKFSTGQILRLSV